MGKSKVKLPTRWSYSGWATWTECAYKYARKYIHGDKEPEGPALARGIMVHDLAAKYLTREIRAIPPQIRPLRTEYKNLRAARPVVEKFWGVDADWMPRDYDSWVVMKMDAAVLPAKRGDTLYIQDLKTGRERDSHMHQASLYAVIGAAINPSCGGVLFEFWYPDEGGTVKSFDFSMPRIRKLRDHWKKEGERVLAPKQKFLPTPSEGACRWCHLRSDKDGPCDAWKKLRKAGSYGR